MIITVRNQQLHMRTTHSLQKEKLSYFHQHPMTSVSLLYLIISSILLLYVTMCQLRKIGYIQMRIYQMQQLMTTNLSEEDFYERYIDPVISPFRRL